MAMKTNARLSPRKPCASRRAAIVSRRVPVLDEELDLRGIGRSRRRQGGPEVLGHDVAHEGQLQRGRIVLGDAHDRAGDHRTERGQPHGQHDRRQDEGEDQELEQSPTGRRRDLPRDRRDRAGPAPRTRARSRSRRRPDRTGGPASHGRPVGVRRSGSSCAGLLGVWAAGGGRTEPGSCVELVLEDDGRCLAIDPRPMGVALGLARRPTGSAPLHRAEAGFGEVAAQALVAQCNRKSQSRWPARRPRLWSRRPADLRLRMLRAAARRRGPRSLRPRRSRAAAASSSSSVGGGGSLSSGRAADAVVVAEGESDRDARRGRSRAGGSWAGRTRWCRRLDLDRASETVRSTRLSKLGIEPDQSGETLISTCRTARGSACASATDLPRMSFVRCSGSRTATCWADAVTGKLTV